VSAPPSDMEPGSPHGGSQRPWVRLYGELPATITAAHATGLDMARTACLRRLDEPLLHYFGTTLTGQVAEDSDALASALAKRGVGPGDRVALYMQNVPQFPIALIATWKLGATVVTVNPMLRERELRAILTDSEAAALISLEDLHASVASQVLAGTPVKTAITTSPLDYLDEVPTLLAGTARMRPPGAEDLSTLVADHAGERPAQVQVDPDDIASIAYTSGTTGPAKGAMNLHRNFAFASSAWAEWVRLSEQGRQPRARPPVSCDGADRRFGPQPQRGGSARARPPVRRQRHARADRALSPNLHGCGDHRVSRAHAGAAV
jgi:long-chain acyl-CoA synthetase